MKLSLNWIKQYVTLPADFAPEKLAHDLTMSTVEVEGFEQLSDAYHNMVVGKIIDITPHPNADALKIAKTLVGEAEPVDIVCGGSNLAENQYVAVANAGAKVRWHGEGELVELKPAKIRGVVSNGMICAANEIGLADLFPMSDEKEIVDLSSVAEECKLEAGQPLATALGLDDVIFDIDNKSLTNRPDLWGHYGMAREFSAIYDLPFKTLCEPIALPPEDEKRLKVTITETQACNRYIGVLMECDASQASPFWLRRILALLEQRSINLPVDLTNYVMLCLGQPMHVFDYDKLAQPEILVRFAKEGENSVFLDEEEYNLSSKDLVIADQNGPIALAGVIGGLASGVTQDTKRILVESANFYGAGVRRTSMRQGVRTESSMRFEKGIDAQRAKTGVDLFFQTFNSVGAEFSLQASQDAFPVKPKSVTVEVDLQFINSRIGKELSVSEVKNKLALLHFDIKEKDGLFTLGVPSWRATGDVSIPEDIVEEVARLYGYDNIDFIPPTIVLDQALAKGIALKEKQVREYLAFSAGMHELMTYPWADEQLLHASGYSKNECLALADPPSPEQKYLQCSLIPNLILGIRQNRKHFSDFAIFELASVYSPQGSYSQSDKDEELPHQERSLAGAVIKEDAREAFFTAKGILEGLCHRLNIRNYTFRKTDSARAWAQPGSALELIVGDQKVAMLALLSGKTARASQIKLTQAGVFEIEVNKLLLSSEETIQYQKLSQYPTVDYDLALLIDTQLPWEELVKNLPKDQPLLKKVSFLEEYTGKQLPEGKKSLAFRMTFGDDTKTLSSEVVGKLAKKVLSHLEKTVGATLRG